MADSSPLAHSPTLAVSEPRVRDDDDQLAVGATVGEYVVDRFIGAGAMGEVYGGTHPVIGKRVAIKVLRHELAASAEAAERFTREARAVNQIDHENVVDVFAFGRLEDGRLYLVMDLVEGRSLRAHLVDGPLELDRALEILGSIADALDAAHARGVVHRDLKPDNIVLSTAGKVFVLDFGIAKLISTVSDGDGTEATSKAGPGTLTGAGTWLGTPGYMAPEQWSIDGAGPASDRYALGVIAFELLTGALPYSATSVPGMMEQHFRAEIPSLSSRGAIGLPASLDTVIRKALAKDPDHRYRTARELVTALRDAAGTGAFAARGAVTPPSGPRRNYAPVLAAVGVLGVGAVAAVFVLSGDPPAERRTSANTAGSSRATPPGDNVAVEITTVPSGAEVRTAKGLLDLTPTELFAKPGETVDLVIRLAGYLPEKRSVQVRRSQNTLDVRLVPVDSFQGVWQLPDGQLRAFERRGERVEVFKLRTVSGERRWSARYVFELVDEGIAFGGAELVNYLAAPDEPTCAVPMRVDYHYDPRGDVLEQRREFVEIDFVNGKCIERKRWVEPAKLVRADGRPTSLHEIAMPVGTPVEGTQPPSKQAQTKVAPGPQKPIGKKGKLPPTELPADPEAPTPTYTSPKTVPSGTEQTLSSGKDAQVVPEPTGSVAPAIEPLPQKAASPPPQKQAPTKTKSAPKK